MNKKSGIIDLRILIVLKGQLKKLVLNADVYKKY